MTRNAKILFGIVVSILIIEQINFNKINFNTMMNRRFFDNMLDGFYFNLDNEVTEFIGPKTKVEESENGYSIKLALPGVKSKEVSVELDSAKNYIIVESETNTTFVSKFKKTYEVPTTIDLDSIEVIFKNGVMEITMSRKEEASKKKIF
jgi:HSP20 family protein